jgi:hypothetical protein
LPALAPAEAEPDEPPVAPPPDPVAPPSEVIDPIREAAQLSPAARQGLSTKRALYHRLVLTRRLLGLWRRLGPYLKGPERRLSKQEAGELLRLLGQLEDLLEDFPPPLGEAGQPGYLLVALTQPEDARARTQQLSVSQRESLLRDWQNGRKFLHLHRKLIHDEWWALRRRGLAERLWRAARAALNERPAAAVLGALALLALAVALYRTLRLSG